MNLTGLKLKLADRLFHWKASEKIFPFSPGEIKSLSFVLDSRDAVLLEKFSEFGRKFRILESDLVRVICSDPDEDEGGELSFCDADINWTGKITKPEIRGFLERPFDVMIVFSDRTDSALEFLVRNARAGLKVGRAENSEGLYDLEIFTGYSEVDVFLKEVEKYLEILKYIFK